MKLKKALVEWKCTNRKKWHLLPGRQNIYNSPISPTKYNANPWAWSKTNRRTWGKQQTPGKLASQETEPWVLWVSLYPSVPCYWSVAKLYSALCYPMGCKTPGLPAPHHLLEFAYLELRKLSTLKMPMSSNKRKSFLSSAKGSGKRPPNKTKKLLDNNCSALVKCHRENCSPTSKPASKAWVRSLDVHTRDAVKRDSRIPTRVVPQKRRKKPEPKKYLKTWLKISNLARHTSTWSKNGPTPNRINPKTFMSLMCVEFCQMSSLHQLMQSCDHMIIFIQSLKRVNDIDFFFERWTSVTPDINSAWWSWFIIFLLYCQILLVNILPRFLFLYSWGK